MRPPLKHLATPLILVALVVTGAVAPVLGGWVLAVDHLGIDIWVGHAEVRADLAVFLVLAALDTAPFMRRHEVPDWLRVVFALFVGARIGVHVAAGWLTLPGLVVFSGIAAFFALRALPQLDAVRSLEPA